MPSKAAIGASSLGGAGALTAAVAIPLSISQGSGEESEGEDSSEIESGEKGLNETTNKTNPNKNAQSQDKTKQNQQVPAKPRKPKYVASKKVVKTSTKPTIDTKTSDFYSTEIDKWNVFGNGGYCVTSELSSLTIPASATDENSKSIFKSTDGQGAKGCVYVTWNKLINQTSRGIWKGVLKAEMLLFNGDEAILAHGAIKTKRSKLEIVAYR